MSEKSRVLRAFDYLIRDGNEVLGVEEIESVRPILFVLIACITFLGFLFTATGMYIMFVNDDPNLVSLEFLGSKITNGNVGLASMLLGAVMFTLVLRRAISALIKAIEK